MRLSDLRVEHAVAPIGIDPAAPLFSFLADAEGTFTAELVTADGETVARRTISLCEAGGFRFDGAVLSHGTRYCYRVTCGGTVAQIRFETAVAFAAPFITPSEPIPFPRLTRRFFLPADAGEVRLAITGLGLYRAELNGVKVGDRYLTPGCNDYDIYLRFDTYDVGALCRRGAVNDLCVELGAGWYSGRYGIDKPPESGGNVWGGEPLCALTLYEADSGRTFLESDGAFQAARSHCTESSIYDGEVRDLTRAAGESVPCRVTEQNRQVVPFFGAPIRACAELEATLYVSPKGENILDFGQNMVGFVRVTATLPKGARIRLLHGEVLQDGCFYRDNLRTARAEAVYVSDGKPQVYEPYFSYFGFRYVKVEGIDQVNPAAFRGVVLSSDTGDVSSCVTSDAGLNRLLSNTRWGQLGNFLDIPTDCPQRDERLGWTADAQVFAATACYRSDCYAFYKKYLRDLRAEQRAYYGGDIPMYCPSLRGEAGHGGAVWADCATILPTVLYRFYGDRGQLARDYPMMRDYCDLLLRRDADEGGRGLITQFFTFGDWLAQDGVCEQALSGGTDAGYISSLYYYHSLCLTSDAAEVLGNSDDLDRYRTAAERVRAAILDEFFAPSGRLTVDTQTAYVLALRFGVYRNRAVLLGGFRERLRRDFYRMKTGFCGTPLLLPTLFACGMDRDAYRVLFSRDCPGWLYAVDLGATTVWERWNSLLPDGRISGINMNSLNHYAYGAVCESIYGDIAGLRPTSAGWRSAQIAPHPDYRLKKISLSYVSVAGLYAVAWEMTDGGRFLFDATVPAGCTALLRLPDETVEILPPGTHRRNIPTPRHLCHPFSLDTPNLDILSDPIASSCLHDLLPRAWSMVTGENREFLLQNGHFLLSLPMFGVTPSDATRYRRTLEAIKK